MIILYFHLPYFHISNSAVLFAKHSGTFLSYSHRLDVFDETSRSVFWWLSLRFTKSQTILRQGRGMLTCRATVHRSANPCRNICIPFGHCRSEFPSRFNNANNSSNVKSWCKSWWHQIETFSALLAICAGNLPITGEFPAETFPRYWSFVRGIHRSPVNSPQKGQWSGSLMLSLICAWINGWVNKSEAGDLRRHRTHYGVTVMTWSECSFVNMKHFAYNSAANGLLQSPMCVIQF